MELCRCGSVKDLEIILVYPGAWKVTARVLTRSRKMPNQSEDVTMKAQGQSEKSEDRRRDYKPRNTGASRNWKRQGNALCSRAAGGSVSC